MKLTYVIPLYNTERFILECLDSLYKQSLNESEFEVIVVNDGSTDSGPALVAAFAAKKSNCRILNQRNAGLSAARNTGLKEARGEFVMFVDADDYLLPDNVCPFLKKLVAEKLDFIRGEKIDIDYDGTLLSASAFRKGAGELMDGAQFCTKVVGNECYAWLLILRKTFLEQHRLLFPEGVALCEDVFFLFHLCNVAKRTMYLDQPLYAYRRNNPVSILATAANKEQLFGYIGVLAAIQDIKNERMKPAVERAVSSGVCMILYWAASLPKAEKEAVVQALNIPAFSRLRLSGSIRFKIQILIYNLFSARGFLFFKRISDLLK